MIQKPRKIDAFFGFFLEDGMQIMLLFFLSIAIVIALIFVTLSIFHPYPLDYGEAPLVDQAMRLAAGQNIYRADISTPPYTISNYPPLYIVSLIPFVKLFGPNFWAGRVISWLCALASSVFLALIIQTHTKDRLASVITLMTFLVIPYVVSWSSLLRIDLLALAFSLAGMYFLVRWPTGRWGLVVGGLLLVAAIYTRQSYALAAPLATFVWLLAHDWRRAFGLAAWVGGLTLILFLILNTLTQGGFYFNIVTANINEFGMERLEWNLHRIWEAAPILLILGGSSLFLVRRWNRSWPLVAPYLIGAGLSALTIGKIGSNVNYFLELCAALSLAVGSIVAWSRKVVGIHILRIVLLALLTFQTGILLHTTLEENVTGLRARMKAVSDLRNLEDIVANTQGPILADEYMGMITLQGRFLTVQPFEVTQLAHAGLWDQTPLIQSIQDKEFPLILIHYFPEFEVYKERWTPEMLAAIDRSYVVTDILADTRVYKPITIPVPVEACPAAPWRLPSSGVLGIQWKEGGLNFYGRGSPGTVPVYAVADGLLTRLPGWVSAVAILHDDPLRPGEKIWSFYADMAGADGFTSFVEQDFPPGVAGIPVEEGQLLGYQGTWSGRALWPIWGHVRFSVVQAAGQGAFPEDLSPEKFLDPSLYLGMNIKHWSQEPDSQPLICKK